MARSKGKWTHCRECGAPDSPENGLSTRGLCSPCAVARKVESATQMAAKSGPFYDRWLASNGPQGRPETPWSPYSRVPR